MLEVRIVPVDVGVLPFFGCPGHWPGADVETLGVGAGHDAIDAAAIVEMHADQRAKRRRPVQLDRLGLEFGRAGRYDLAGPGLPEIGHHTALRFLLSRFSDRPVRWPKRWSVSVTNCSKARRSPPPSTACSWARASAAG